MNQLSLTTTHRFQGASDPDAATILKILGGESYEGNVFTKSQVQQLARVYGFDLSTASSQAPELERAANVRNLMRHVKSDGMRLMAILAKWCEPGEDPVKVLVRMAADNGYDVGCLVGWAEGGEPGTVEDDP